MLLFFFVSADIVAQIAGKDFLKTILSCMTNRLAAFVIDKLHDSYFTYVLVLAKCKKTVDRNAVNCLYNFFFRFYPNY